MNLKFKNRIWLAGPDSSGSELRCGWKTWKRNQWQSCFYRIRWKNLYATRNPTSPCRSTTTYAIIVSACKIFCKKEKIKNIERWLEKTYNYISQKMRKIEYRLEYISKTRVSRVQKWAKNDATSNKNESTVGKTRIEKQAFRMECIAKTKVRLLTKTWKNTEQIWF